MDAIEYHEQLAKEWDKRYSSGGFRRRFSFILSAIFSKQPQSGVWLDIGCGTGTFSRALAAAGRRVVGIDGAPTMIAEANCLAESSGLSEQVSFRIERNLEQLPFRDGEFDGCICFSVLEYLENPESACREMARVVKPGGTIIISVPNKDALLRRLARMSPWSKTESGDLAYIRHSKFELAAGSAEAWFRSAGLMVKSRLTFDPLIPRQLHRVLRPSMYFFELVTTESSATS
jgi:ubiquinone/menaquinone biosynthesis C-methylase UbiE